MNGKHTEFMAYDRVAELRREASVDLRPVDARPERGLWPARIAGFSARTLGRIRLVLRHANARRLRRTAATWPRSAAD
jgi:hypothetical protein